MSIDQLGGPQENEALKFKQKLESSEIQVNDQSKKAETEEISDLEAGIDVAYHAIDLLNAAIQGKGDRKEAAEFADGQMKNLMNLLDSVQNQQVRAQIASQIREINDLQIKLSEESNRADLAEAQARIQSM